MSLTKKQIETIKKVIGVIKFERWAGPGFRERVKVLGGNGPTNIQEGAVMPGEDYVKETLKLYLGSWAIEPLEQMLKQEEYTLKRRKEKKERKSKP